MKNFFIAVGLGFAAAIIVYGIALSVQSYNAGYNHQQQMLNCKAAQYDVYRYMVTIGLNRWTAACSAQVMTENGGKLPAAREAEKQCFIQLEDCGK